jgi:hypothetical protein
VGFPQIGHAARDLFVRPAVGVEAWRPGEIHPDLSRTHYRTLLKVERRDARDFYEIESIKHGWSARQLERQIGSMLFERLLKSRDKEGVLPARTRQWLCLHWPAGAYHLGRRSFLSGFGLLSSRYQFQLPSEETLKNELEREMKALQDERDPSS